MTKKWSDRSIVYLAGSDQEWSPDSLYSTGVGGSETAVIHLAGQWVKMGYEVTVYAPCAGTFDGVEYLHYSEFDPSDQFNILICWRYNQSVLTQPIQAKLKCIDLHEIHHPRDINPLAFQNADKIFVKSEFQKEHYTQYQIPSEKFAVIENGVEIPEDIEIKKSETPRIVYCASYDRGLDMLLKHAWPVILRSIPDTELHIYYGWDTFPGGEKYLKMQMEINYLMFQQGVIHHGRIPQHTLLEEKAKSHIHYHVCTVLEIDSISVKESAAVQCLPIISEIGGLKEIPFGVHMQQDPHDPGTHIEAAKIVVELLQNPEKINGYFKNINIPSWAEIAQLWVAEFK